MCTRNISTMDLLVSLVGYMYLGGNTCRLVSFVGISVGYMYLGGNTCRLVSFVGISVGYMNLDGNRLWIV